MSGSSFLLPSRNLDDVPPPVCHEILCVVGHHRADIICLAVHRFPASPDCLVPRLKSAQPESGSEWRKRKAAAEAALPLARTRPSLTTPSLGGPRLAGASCHAAPNARALLDCTREQLAKMSGVPVRNLADFETGATAPRAGTLQKLSDAFSREGIALISVNGAPAGVTLTR